MKNIEYHINTSARVVLIILASNKSTQDQCGASRGTARYFLSSSPHSPLFESTGTILHRSRFLLIVGFLTPSRTVLYVYIYRPHVCLECCPYSRAHVSRLAMCNMRRGKIHCALYIAGLYSYVLTHTYPQERKNGEKK